MTGLERGYKTQERRDEMQNLRLGNGKNRKVEPDEGK